MKSHFIAFAALASAALFALAPLSALAQGFGIAPGVLVDADRVYVMRPGGGLEAVSASSGAVLWSSDRAAKPIAIRGGRLIAQAERPGPASVLHMAALDPVSGAVLEESAIDLGAGVVVSIDEGLGSQFLLDAESYDTDDGALVWRYVTQPVRGMAGPPAPVAERFGALEVDAAGRVDAAAGGFPRASGRPPYESPRVLRVTPETPAPATPIVDMESMGVYRLDGEPVVFDTERQMERAPQGGVFISEGRPGEEFPMMRRLPGDQAGFSADERYILASGFVGPTDAAEPYRWVIFERRTYERLGSFRSKTSLAPFMIVAGCAIHERQPYAARLLRRGGLTEFPLAVVARDLRSGEAVWTRPVRETRYIGPLPP